MKREDILIGYRILRPITIQEDSPVCNLIDDQGERDVRYYIYIPKGEISNDRIEANEDFEKHINMLYHQSKQINIINGKGNEDLKDYVEISVPLIFSEGDDVVTNEDINSYIDSIMSEI